LPACEAHALPGREKRAKRAKITAMTSTEIRQSFLDFFREKKHTIVPSSSLLPDAPNLLFTNAGMNQFVPIFLGQQRPPFTPPRAADTQKCIRAGGKHNDLDDVGFDTYHHTFFEMLGNWSFGDYFKKEVIEWAWELVVRRWKFPAERLYATVYQPGPNEPSEFDQEAHEHWARLFRAAGLDPAVHVVTGNKKDNFWMMGETGPCGPCSELHVDLTAAGDTRGSLVNAGDPRCIEIWNLVFIQFNANPDGSFSPLPQRHVDTGMGFERVTAIIQGTNHLTDFSGAISNYETDIFRPIFDEIEKLSGKRYGGTLPGRDASTLSRPANFQPAESSEQQRIDVAFRVIADHIRTLSFAIADGVQPSNEGRGYVLRRILRRAVRYGRSLGFHEPFFYNLVDVLSLTMGEVFPELRNLDATIKTILRGEEESFSRTLDRGIKLFENEGIFFAVFEQVTKENKHHYSGQTSIAQAEEEIEVTDDEPSSIGNVKFFIRNNTIELTMKELQQGAWKSFVISRPQISGEFAFKLYDTYGFPLDLTQLMARKRGMSVDTEGFEKLMEEQRRRARAGQKKEIIEVSNLQPLWGPTRFVGYDHLTAEGGRFQLEGNRLLLEISPFYAEMGGQVGDTGWIEGTHGERTAVLNTIRSPNGVHVLRIADPDAFGPGAGVPFRQIVDADRRRLIQAHHTVTHLLHWALHEVVNRNATQKGSYVGPEKLTFDFASAPLTKEQVRAVEKLVNEKIAENAPVSWKEIPYPEAKVRADIIQFFGDKYGDRVRVVQIGGAPNELNGYSMELCGGTHTRNTGEIGSFRIVSEGAIAAGIRRIEAIAGDAVSQWAESTAARQEEKFAALAARRPGLGELPPFENTPASIDTRAAYLERLESEVRDWEKAHAKAAEASLHSRAAAIAKELAADDGAGFRVARVPEADGKLLQAVTDALKADFEGPIFLAGEKDGRVALIASVPKPLTTRFQAGKIIQETAPLVGGKGGGRPELAQGGGTNPTKIDDALARARALLSQEG
jgi:alanyl-tRNA synthetase